MRNHWGKKKEIIAKELDDFANFYENVLKKQIYMNMEIIDINFPEIDTSELKKYYATIVAAKDSIKGISSGVCANLLAYGGIIKINGIA